MNKELSLRDGNKLVRIPPAIAILEPAHVSRYLIMARLIKQIVGNDTKVKILDVGGKKGLLREFGIKSTIIDMEESDEDDYVQGDALRMPFKDNTYDVVVSCDVLEHIPSKDREQFISEMARVSKGYVVIGAPFDMPGVSNSEKAANKFYKDITTKDHRWLVEHIENGLPDKKAIEAYLKKRKFSYAFFRHLSLELWDLTTRIHFLHAVFGDSSSVGKLANRTYEKYYSDMCELDFSDTGYRTFCIINKNHEFKVDMPDKALQSEAQTNYKTFLNKQFLAALEGLGSEKRNVLKQYESYKYKTSKQGEHLKQLENKLSDSTKELSEIKNSKTYKLAMRLSKAKNFYK